MTHMDLHELLASLAGQPDGPSPESIAAAERIIDWCADGGLLLPDSVTDGPNGCAVLTWTTDALFLCLWASRHGDYGAVRRMDRKAIEDAMPNGSDWAATTALLAELLPLREVVRCP